MPTSHTSFSETLFCTDLLNFVIHPKPEIEATDAGNSVGLICDFYNNANCAKRIHIFGTVNTQIVYAGC